MGARVAAAASQPCGSTAGFTLVSGLALPPAPGCSMSWSRTMQTTPNSQMVLTGTSFLRTTLTDTESQERTTECGGRQQRSMKGTPVKELMLTGTGISTGLRLEPLVTAAARLITALNLSLRLKLATCETGWELARTGSSSTKPFTATVSSSLFHGATLRRQLLAMMQCMTLHSEAMMPFMQSMGNTTRLAASLASSTLQRAPPSTGPLVSPTSHTCTALS